MAHSYTSNLVHLVFSTKERRNLILSNNQEKLWAYLVGIGKNKKTPVLAVGGMPNHVHLLLALPADQTLAKTVQALKANSSRWLRDHGIEFAWQEGYGAFSVSASQAPRVKDYIRNQAQHHTKRTFEEEFLELLRKSGVDYDPRHVFGSVPSLRDSPRPAMHPSTDVLG